MSNLREELKLMLKEQPFVEEALHEGLINISSLARRVRPELERRMGKSVHEGAIVMAIRRIGPGLQLQLQSRFRKFMAQLGDIIVRSNLVDYTFQNSGNMVNCEHEFLNSIKGLPSGFYSFSRGVDETTIIISAHFEPSLKTAFSNESVTNVLPDLSSITLKMPTSNRETLGLYYFFFKNLSEGGINVLEVISTSNEATFIVKQSDVDRAFSILNGLKR
jgi:hypothetical protein